MKTMGKIYPAILLAIGLLFGSNAKVLADQTGWLLRTDFSVEVQNITTDEVSLGSKVYVFDDTTYTYSISTYLSGFLGSRYWSSPSLVINAGEQFVFEWYDGGNDEYLGWPYAYVPVSRCAAVQ